MKKAIRYAILTFICIFGLALFSSTQTVAFADDSLYYTLDTDDYSAYTIVGAKSQAVVDGVLSIPSTINGKPVVSLGRKTNDWDSQYIHLYDHTITSLDLSHADNLQSIEKLCFKNDSNNLSGSLYLPASLSYIGKGAFTGTHFSDVYIPDSDSCITLENACLDSVNFFYFYSDSTLQMYKSADIWSTYADKMILLNNIKIVNVSFEGLDNSIQCVVGKPFSYSLLNDVWQDNPNFSFPVPSRDYYDFAGWSLNDQILLESDIVPDLDNISLKPIWRERIHNISYISDLDTTSFPNWFSESQGCALPSISHEDLFYFWDGWYLDEDCTQKISHIDMGYSSDITLYSKKSSRNMSISFQLEKDCYWYNQSIPLSFDLINVPSYFHVTPSFYIYNNVWQKIQSDSLDGVAPGTYLLRCEVVVSYNDQSVTLKKDTSVCILKHQVTVGWDNVDSFTFSNSIITPQIEISCDTLPDAYSITTYKFENGDWIESTMFDAGSYKVTISPLYDYVEILGSPTKQYIVSPLSIDLGYSLPYKSIPYGTTFSPLIKDFVASCGFENKFVREQILVKKNNSWYDFSSRTLDQPVSKLKNIENIGQYEYRLYSTNSNYSLSGTYQKFTLDVCKQALDISWSNLSFEYDGFEHVPSAQATNLAGENIPLVVSGARIQANTSELPTYIAEATLLDTNYTLTNSSTSFTISKTDACISVSYSDSKFYDGTPAQITAVVKDNHGVFADNVSMFCLTDLKSVGVHEVDLAWEGDSNHFSAPIVKIYITIKTQNILYGNDDSPQLTVENSNGFSSLNDVVISEQNLESLNLQKSSYNSITSLYDVQNIYSLNSANTMFVSLNISIPKNVHKISDVKVFKVNSDGSIQEVQYVVSDDCIKILSSKTNSTYILVVEKNTKNTTLYILVAVVAMCLILLAVCIISISRRKRKLSKA